jgi:hypothetical protein
LKEAHKFFEEYKGRLVGGLNTFSLARIERFDPVLMQADVTPLYADDVPMVLNVPVQSLQSANFIIRVPYKKGDIVGLAYSQRDIDPVMYGGGDASVRKLAIDDAIVTGGIRPYTQPLLKTDHPDDLIIALRNNFDAKIVLRPDGSILIEAKKDIDLVSEQNLNLTAKNIHFNQHT